MEGTSNTNRKINMFLIYACEDILFKTVPINESGNRQLAKI